MALHLWLVAFVACRSRILCVVVDLSDDFFWNLLLTFSLMLDFVFVVACAPCPFIAIFMRVASACNFCVGSAVNYSHDKLSVHPVFIRRASATRILHGTLCDRHYCVIYVLQEWKWCQQYWCNAVRAFHLWLLRVTRISCFILVNWLQVCSVQGAPFSNSISLIEPNFHSSYF